MTGFVKHWPDLLLGLGSVLTLTGSLLNLALYLMAPLGAVTGCRGERGSWLRTCATRACEVRQ